MATLPVTIDGQSTIAALPPIQAESFVGTSSAVPGSGFLDSLGSSLASSTGIPILGQLGNLAGGASAVAQTDPSALLSAAHGASTDWVSLFLRGVIIILGFIFITIGLSMFKTGSPIVIERASGKLTSKVKKGLK